MRRAVPVPVLTPAHVAVLLVVVDRFGPAPEEVTGVDSDVQGVEVVATAAVARVPVTPAVAIVSVTVTHRAVAVPVTHRAVAVPTTQDLLGCVSLLPNQGSRGVRIAGEEGSGKEVQGFNSVPPNVGKLARRQAVVLRQVRAERNSGGPEALPKTRLARVELKICHAKCLQTVG